MKQGEATKTSEAIKTYVRLKPILNDEQSFVEAS